MNEAEVGRVIAALVERIHERRTAPPAESYTARLLCGDEDALLKKIVEEAGEAALAAKGGARARLTEELADLLFHCLVVMARYNVSMDDIAATLVLRQGRSGIAEKAARKEK